MDLEGQEMDPMVGVLVNVNQSAIGEIRQAPSNLTATVISSIFPKKQQRLRMFKNHVAGISSKLLQSSARLPERRDMSPRENEDRDKTHEEDHEQECHQEDERIYVSSPCNDAADTGTLESEEGDSLVNLSDSTDLSSCPSTGSINWRNPLACGLPMCGGPWLLDKYNNIHPDLADAISDTYEEDDTMSVQNTGNDAEASYCSVY